MKTEAIHSLTSMFEGHAQLTESGIELWLARDLQYLLGYSEWRNLLKVVSKAKTTCEVSGHPTSKHFVDVNKMVGLDRVGSARFRTLLATQAACERDLLGVRPTQQLYAKPPLAIHIALNMYNKSRFPIHVCAHRYSNQRISMHGCAQMDRPPC